MELALVAETGGQSERLVTLGFVEYREGAVTRERCKLLADVGGVRFLVEAVGQPDDVRVFAVCGFERIFESRQSARPIGFERLRYEC